MEQEFQERQQEELEVLSAIYLDDFIDLRSKEMQLHKATPEFCLKLTPMQSMVGKDVHARIDMLIKFTTKYPLDPPIIKLANAKGLSDEQVSGLRKELVQMADKLTGEVMVLQLAQHAENYLYRHNTPLLSFYEQMVSNQQMQIEKKRKEEESKKAQHLAEATEEEIDVIRQVREEMNQRTEMIEARKKRNRGITMQKSNSLGQEEPSFRSCQREAKTKVDIISFISKEGNRLIHIGKCCGHHYDDECIRTAFDAQTGELLSVIEWKYGNKSTGRKSRELYQEEIDGTYKQVKSMEQELNVLVGKTEHVNLLSYMGYSTSIEDGVVFCRILTEAVPTESLDQEVRGQGLSLETLRTYSKQMVDAMAYLHNKNIVHRDFKLEYVYKQRMEILKVGGYGILKRLADLKLTQQQAGLGTTEDTQKRISRQGKKGDVLNFGLAVLSLAEGKHHVNFPAQQEEGLNPDLENFVNKCISIDDKERWSFHQLSDHPFLLPTMTSNSLLERRPEDSSNSKDDAVENENESVLLMGNLVLTGKSRLKSEFEVLQWLGQGGFGSVVKVRNKLDGKFYAIKKVGLNPHNLQLNKRITREVKLLSRLNHENVVRYYTAWIESEDVPPVTESSSDTSASFASSQKAKKAEPRPNRDLTSEQSLLEINAFEAPDYVPDFSSGQVSWYDKSKASNHNSAEQSNGQPSSDSSDDESAKMRISPLTRNVPNFESSDGVSFQVDESMFQFGDLLNSEESEDEAGETQAETTNSDISHALQYLYIQMEYYEKNTLRDIIDEGLWQDKDRVWRLFREMVEGLAHVHSQGIIHRDLKPVNIFMDAYEHVKIGDFGLATSHASSKVEGPDLDATCLHSDEKMTGKVGTALYVAPELGSAVSRVKFSQKVDIYSLGIIFFEMCHKPLATGMERVKMIGSLRKPEIVLPPELEQKSSSREKSLLKLLLKHNPDERPSAQELLENGYVPPKLEDRHLDEILKHTLNQSNSSLYQRLLSGLFHQSMGPVVEQIYDTDLHGKSESTILEELRVINHVEQVISGIFECHGAIKMHTPLLMPKGRILPDMEGHVSVMDHSGVVLTLPFDSRLNFARFVARNDITNFKRYVIGKVYRDPKLHRAHPREIRECAFDIVTEAETNLVPEAEVLFAGYELIKAFPSLEKRHYYVRISHTLLLQAILTHAGLSEERHHRVVEILQDARGDKMKHGTLREFLLDNGITEIGFTRFSQFLNFEGTLSKARELLQVLRKCKGSIGAQTKQAFVDLENILRHCKDFGIDIPIVIFPSLVYNIKHFSGFMYQFVAENKRKSRHGGVDILAAGGRYDDLIEKYRLPGNSRVFPSAVGISVAVEKIIGSCLDENKAESGSLTVHNECEALVSSVGQTTSYTWAIRALRTLWAAKVPASMSYNGSDQGLSPEEIQDYCKAKNIHHVVIIKMDDADNVKYRTLEQEKFVESKHQNISSVLSEITQRISRKLETRDVGKSFVESVAAPLMPPSENTDTRVTFVMPEKKKLPINARRKYESHMMSTLAPVINQLSVRTEVEVVVVELPSVTVCDIAGHLELSREDEDYEDSVTYLVEINHKVPKIYLQRICSTLRQIQPRKPQGKGDRSLIILYTLKDDFFKIIV